MLEKKFEHGIEPELTSEFIVLAHSKNNAEKNILSKNNIFGQ